MTKKQQEAMYCAKRLVLIDNTTDDLDSVIDGHLYTLYRDNFKNLSNNEAANWLKCCLAVVDALCKESDMYLIPKVVDSVANQIAEIGY